MESNEIDLEKTLSIWWSMFWRVFLVGMLVGAMLGVVVGSIASVMGYSEFSGLVGAVMSWIGSISVSIWALKASLSKKHGGYSVVLVKS